MILLLFDLRQPMALFSRHLKNTCVWWATCNVRTLRHTTYDRLSIQRMRLSAYNVSETLHTMYVWSGIQCTYETFTQRTFLAKKSWKNVHYIHYIDLKESLKKWFYQHCYVSTCKSQNPGNLPGFGDLIIYRMIISLISTYAENPGNLPAFWTYVEPENHLKSIKKSNVWIYKMQVNYLDFGRCLDIRWT